MFSVHGLITFTTIWPTLLGF